MMAADGTGDNLDGETTTTQLAPTHTEVEALCKELFEQTIGKEQYEHVEGLKWNKKLVESVTQALVGMSRPYKYCVSCIIMEVGAGVGLNVASTCYWDRATDVSYSIRCESKNVIGVISIFAVNYV
uniref:Dynein light chain n=1 Tax=Panagrolaimus sp. ES5 TaxID=591445 RepID=A0AC34GXF6_9BILA